MLILQTRTTFAPHLPSARAELPVRRGFTLVELLVALVILDLALLGLVAASAVAARQLADARVRSHAAATALSRLEWAASRPCDGAQYGSAVQGAGLRESWSLDTPVRGTRLVTDTVDVTSGTVPIRRIFVSRVTCGG
jgi:Tfp pilus assembly protein PilV